MKTWKETPAIDCDILPASIDRQRAGRTVCNRGKRAAQKDCVADAEVDSIGAGADLAVSAGRVDTRAIGIVDCLAKATRAVTGAAFVTERIDGYGVESSSESGFVENNATRQQYGEHRDDELHRRSRVRGARDIGKRGPQSVNSPAATTSPYAGNRSMRAARHEASINRFAQLELAGDAANSLNDVIAQLQYPLTEPA